MIPYGYVNKHTKRYKLPPQRSPGTGRSGSDGSDDAPRSRSAVVSCLIMLEAERKRQGKKQQDVASELGCSRQCVSNWENFVRSPQVEELFRWAHILGCRIRLEKSENRENNND